MAQRTGPERLLTQVGKVASAGVTPALAAVVILVGLAGCGGGSDEQTASAPPAVSSTGAERPAKSGEAAEETSTAKDEVTSNAQGTAASQGTSPGAGGKHGAKIVPPEGPREPAPTPKEIAQATVANMTLTSPSLPPGGGGVTPLLSAYTCDGTDSWPALAWQEVPRGSAELVLFAMNVQPVKGKLFFDWAVAGIDPALTGIEASRLPRGAVVGQNSFDKRGYSICPAQGTSETYMFALYALPKRLSPARGFDPSAFRRQVLALSGNAGLLPVSYGRG
jgi:phosphatidylethanolamine-binding protein (PEBP) family uncharacterized protein